MYAYKTERVVDGDGIELIARLIADEGGFGDPREDDNFTHIYGDHRNYTIGDGKPPSEHQYILERGGIRLLYRYMRLFGDPAHKHSKVLAFKKLGMIDHSGISFYTVSIGSSATHWADHGGWDSGAVGYVYITQERWDYLGGGDPDEQVDGEWKAPLGSIAITQRHADRMLEAEVETYDNWARGNVWWLSVVKPCDEHGDDMPLEAIADCPHSEFVDSISGFIGDPDDAWRDMTADLGLREQVTA